jgi:hypothetical protein
MESRLNNYPRKILGVKHPRGYIMRLFDARAIHITIYYIAIYYIAIFKKTLPCKLILQ